MLCFNGTYYFPLSSPLHHVVCLFTAVELLIDEATLSEGRRRDVIEKAHAEEFIHVFVNNAKKLTEFLEHMVKVSRTALNSCIFYMHNSSLYIHRTSYVLVYCARLHRTGIFPRTIFHLLFSINSLWSF